MRQPKKTQELVKVSKPLPPIERTAEGLRDALFDELNQLRSGECTTAHARALANVARLILETARLEFQQIKFVAGKDKNLRLGKKDD